MQYTSRSLRRRGTGSKWEVTLTHKDPISGKPIRTFHTVTADTRKEAERKRNKLIEELQNDTSTMRKSSSCLLETALKSFLVFKKNERLVEESTLKGYQSRARLICRSIGSVRIHSLSPAFINEWMAQLTAEGYAPRTISKTFRLLSQSLDYAVNQNLIAKNPCTSCKPPKAKRQSFAVLDRAERTRMLFIARQIQPMPLGFAIELALTTGMRRGEICALRWSDLSDNKSVTVRRALGEGPMGYYEKEPKTPESRRVIPLTQHTFQSLIALRKEVVAALEQNGDFERDPYILGTISKTSRPYNPSRLSKDFAFFCKLYGFPCTFHGLRHTFATMMIAEGTDIKTVSSYLGHANASMTLDIYAEADPEAKRLAVAKIVSAFDL